jgi:hypothetical protein
VRDHLARFQDAAGAGGTDGLGASNTATTGTEGGR